MKTTRLNRTQRKLLEKATTNSRGCVCVIHGYRTGAKGSYGGRDSRTIRQLRDMGLVGPIEVHSGRHYYGHGECDHYTNAWAYITDAGREALAAHPADRAREKSSAAY